MHEAPQISVVMPAHNTSAYIREAIQSVLKQTDVILELIVIDDGSKDDTAEIVASIKDPRITLLKNPTAGGPSRARNQGIRAARGPYIAFLDSDDVANAGSMRSAVTALDMVPSAPIAFGDLCRIDLQGNVLKPSVLEAYSTFRGLPKTQLTADWNVIKREDFARGLLYENFIGTGSVVVRASALALVGVFDESLFNSEDRDLWFRLGRLGDALASTRIRYSYRVNPVSISHAPSERNARNRIEVLRRERRHWSNPEALTQIDRLIAENFAAIGYSRRHHGRRFAAAASFWRALTYAPSLNAALGVVKAIVGPSR